MLDSIADEVEQIANATRFSGAVQLADEFNITLCGFVRADSLNVYTGQERIKE